MYKKTPWTKRGYHTEPAKPILVSGLPSSFAPSQKPDYLTLAEIETIHADQIERYGGSPGLRDPGQLEAALYRPQTGHYADLIAEATALWESFSQNHTFVDGNKRTALAAAYTLLAINGIRMTAGTEVSRVSRRLRWLDDQAAMAA